MFKFNVSQFPEHSFFKYVKENSGVTSETPRNILQFKNNLLFGWDGRHYTLQILYMNKCNIQETTLQKVIPAKVPFFEINRIAVNNVMNKCAVFGPRGICILKIPLLTTWSANGKYESEITSTSSCDFLDEAYFGKYSSLTIQQIRWYPDRSEEKILVVLTTENALRLYSTDSMQLLKICPFSTRSKNLSVLASLGETAVDFDFGPPLATSYGVKTSFTYRTFILKGNGDVCCVQNLLENKPDGESLSVEGPLSMYPPSLDNYGIDDASSIMVVWSMPPILVLATGTGVLYHTIIIEGDELDQSCCSERSDASGVGDISGTHEASSSMYLLVVGSVEPEMGLCINAERDELIPKPITLYKDPVLRSRYFCTHQGGVHMISLQSTILALEEYVNSSENKEDECEAPALVGNSMKYLFCTRLQLDDFTINSKPLLGFTVMDYPTPMAIALLYSGDIGIVELDSALWDTNNPHDMFLLSPIISDVKYGKKKVHYELCVRKFMDSLGDDGKNKSLVDAPLFKLDLPGNLSSDLGLEFLSRILQNFQRQDMPLLIKTWERIEFRAAMLREAQKCAFEEMDKMENQSAEMRCKAEQLAERYEELVEKKDELNNKCHILFRRVLGNETIEENVSDNAMVLVHRRMSELRNKVNQIRERQARVENKTDEEKQESSFEGELPADIPLVSPTSEVPVASSVEEQNRMVHMNIDNMLSLLQTLQSKMSILCNNSQ